MTGWPPRRGHRTGPAATHAQADPGSAARRCNVVSAPSPRAISRAPRARPNTRAARSSAAAPTQGRAGTEGQARAVSPSATRPAATALTPRRSSAPIAAGLTCACPFQRACARQSRNVRTPMIIAGGHYRHARPPPGRVIRRTWPGRRSSSGYLILNALLPGASSLRRRGPDTEPGLVAQPHMRAPIVGWQPARRWSVTGGISLVTLRSG